MAKYLIVNADDFGICSSVSKGIVDCYLHGIVTSTTIMMNMPYAPEAISLWKKESPHMGLGLHINLSHGKPILPPEKVATLVNEQGNFYSFFTAVKAAFDDKELRNEVQAQFAQFVKIVGHIPDHLDTHQFMANMHPVSWETMLSLASRHKIPIRNAEIFLDMVKLHKFMESRKTPQIKELEMRIPTLQNIYKHYQPLYPHFFNYNFYDSSVSDANIHHILDNLAAGVTELMCHPGYIYDLENDFYLSQRKREVEVLTNPCLKQILHEKNIELITFAQISSKCTLPN